MEIFIVALIPLNYNLPVNMSIHCIMNLKWAKTISPSLYYVATIYLLNDWVKVSHYKLFLPENVEYLKNVNNYVYNISFFSSKGKRS